MKLRSSLILCSLEGRSIDPSLGKPPSLKTLELLSELVAESGRGVKAAACMSMSSCGSGEFTSSLPDLCLLKLIVDETVVREGERAVSETSRTDGAADPGDGREWKSRVSEKCQGWYLHRLAWCVRSGCLPHWSFTCPVAGASGLSCSFAKTIAL